MSENRERFVWAADLINPGPTSRILEVGCGVGLLADELAKRSPTARIVALDRSKPMIEKAIRRNQAHLDAGRMQLVHGSLNAMQVPEVPFDTIAAFNVNLFRYQEKEELNLLHKLLAPQGRFFVFHQPPAERLGPPIPEVTGWLNKVGFEVEGPFRKVMKPAAAWCLIAKRQGKA